MSILKFLFTCLLCLVVVSIVLVSAIGLFLYLTNRQSVNEEAQAIGGIAKSIILTSPAFENDSFLPGKYTKISPPLTWKNIPADTKSLVIIATDFDAPSPKLKLFSPTHWVVFNISPQTNSIEEGVKLEAFPPAKFGKNILNQNAYTGPNPPFGVHNYTFRIYATTLDYINPPNPTKEQILKLISSKTIAYGEIVGKYGKE